MNKKIGISLIVITITFILIILLITGFFVYKQVTQSIVFQNAYLCPDGKTCQIQPFINCSIQTSTQTNLVVFRTNGDTTSTISSRSDMKDKYYKKWAIIDFTPGDDTHNFVVYEYADRTTGCRGNRVNYADGSPMTLPDGTDIYHYVTRDLNQITIVKDCNYGIRFKPSTTSKADLTLTSKEPYKTNKQELYDVSGLNLYTCSRDIKKNGVKVDTITYSNNQPGRKYGNTYSLNENEKLEFSTGTGITGFDINPPQDIPITTCTSSKGTILQIGDAECKDSSTLEKCESISGRLTLTTQEAIPPKVCRNGAIKDAYVVEITVSKLLISKSEKLNIDFKLSGTDDNKNIPVKTEIFRGSSCISDFNCIYKSQLTGNAYPNLGKTSFVLDAPPVGYYTLRVSFSHPDGDYSKDYNVQVTDDLSVIVTADNPVQFDSNPIIVYIKSFQSGSAKQLSNFDVEAYYHGVKVYDYLSENPSLGVIKLSFSDLIGDGNLRTRARGSDESGLWTEWTDYFDIKIVKATILFKTDFITDKCTGSYKLNFETKNSGGELIETQNQITINKPSGGSDKVSASGSNGKYSFNYNFMEGGTYIVRISSSNSLIGNAQLNSGNGELINILTGDACKEDKPDWTLYIILGGFALGIIGFIYFIFFRRK